LAKALDHAPLAEALVLAQAAEDFVTTGDDKAKPGLRGTGYRASTRIH
jgi:hypothetical protein